MTYFLSLLFTLTTLNAFAADVSLTVEEYDSLRQRASIISHDSTDVPLGTVLRIHSKTGTCEIRITEQVNDHLIGMTTGCEMGVITAGMKLAYSPTAAWEQPRNTASEVSTSYDAPGIMREILDRSSVFVGHNFSRQLEGNVYADSSVKDLTGDTALSFGLKGRVYDFTDRISLATELSYETPRTLDLATYRNANGESTGGFVYSPRLSLWSLAVQGEARLMDDLTGFAGLNLSIPSLRNSPFRMGSDIGFQAGANYQLFPQVAFEGLIKITNMNLKNEIGEETDVSLAGLEVRGRYSF